MRNGKNKIFAFFDALLLSGLVVFLMTYFDIRYLFEDTVVTGGDTASWQGIVHHLAEVLLPNGRLMGWDMGNFCGYPNFNFYFLPPFLLAAVSSKIFAIPLTITLKWAIMSGIFLIPITTYFGLRFIGYKFPVPVMGAAGALLFLFNETYTMFGANTLSTFAGEFCYMFAFSLFVLFIGTFYKGTRENRWLVRNGILLGVIGLSHLFVFIPALMLPIYAYFNGTRIRYLAGVGIIAFICMAFWILPMMAFRHPYTTPVYMIWQEFVNLRYSMAGVLLLILFIAPRFAVHVMARLDPPKSLTLWTFIIFVGAGGFAAAYLFGAYLIFGSDIWATGLHFPDPANAVIGKSLAMKIKPLLLSISFGIGSVVVFMGYFLSKKRLFFGFCRSVGAVCFSGIVFLGMLGLHLFIVRKMTDPVLRSDLLSVWFIGGVYGLLCAGFAIYWIFSGTFQKTLKKLSRQMPAERFFLWIFLIFGCGVAYFSAHFLQVPDIRFLPPLSFALLMLFLADTIGPFVAEKGGFVRIMAGVTFCYLVFVTIIFGANKSGSWYRFNNRGYEGTIGYSEFAEANQYLQTVYEKEGLDPLNAPRVGYEKCDLYGRYGGDRVFESLRFFSGRQTLEGIHYAGSVASRFMAFLQTEFSRDIKTPKPQILSKINPDVLPIHFDLYNISQLVVMTDTMKKALSGSPLFEKEVQFGNIMLYRYTACDGRYVDVPKVRPVLYTGKHWVDGFFLWYKYPDINDVLLVPEKFVKDPEDRAVFLNETDNVLDLAKYRVEKLDRKDLKISTRMDDLHVRFDTNKLGVPHLVKVSYFPNWKVEGANGVYPVSPHLMLVIPRKNSVILTYERSRWEIFGLLITGFGALLIIGFVATRRLNLFSKWMSIKIREKWDQFWKGVERTGVYLQPYGFILMVAMAICLIVAGSILRNRPVRTYIAGYHAYKNGNLLRREGHAPQAAASFQRAISIMTPLLDDRSKYDHRDVINSILITAMCHENLKSYDAAEDWYRMLLKEYPYSRYVAEADVKIGRIYRIRMRKLLLAQLERLKGAGGYEKTQFLEGLGWLEKSFLCYQHALEKDPFSVWAEYARNDLKEEIKRMEKLTKEMFLLQMDKKVKKRMEFLTEKLAILISNNPN